MVLAFAMTKVSHIEVKPVSDKEQLHQYLLRDSIGAAYHIGDLDPLYAVHTQWWGAYDRDEAPRAVALMYTGLRLPALLVLGDAEGAEALLDDSAVRQALPGRFYAHLWRSHIGALHPYFLVDKLGQMTRMGLARDAFVDPGLGSAGVVPITHRDTADLMKLYRFYPDNFFEPYQLESGMYFGLRKGGQLISVAGVHVFSEAFDIAALGNIVTHPDHRGHGYSTRCTAVLLRALFEKVSVVGLNVHGSNDAALAVYRKLGFEWHSNYVEGLVEARA